MIPMKTPGNSPKQGHPPKTPWRCPHCGSRAKRVCCRKCLREMCEDCISLLPSVGDVCGLCYDRATEPEEE